LGFQKFFSFLVLVFTFSHEALAAPCCGGGSAIPSLISGDDEAQVSSSISESTVIGEAPAGGGAALYRGDADHEESETLRFDGAYKLSDAIQIGAGIPIVRRARAFGDRGQDRAGVGDVALDVAYEVLPELSYSEWKPKGFLFFSLTLPTSPSTYDAEAPYQLDARGRGFFTIGVGAAFLKTIQNYDFSLIPEFHRSFPRSVVLQDGSDVRLSPGWGGSLNVGAGYSFPNTPFRVGLSLSPVYEGAIQITGDVNSTSASQLVWNTTLSFGYMISSEWSSSLSYADQTLMGPARNVALSRSFALFFQRRWPL